MKCERCKSNASIRENGVLFCIACGFEGSLFGYGTISEEAKAIIVSDACDKGIQFAVDKHKVPQDALTAWMKKKWIVTPDSS